MAFDRGSAADLLALKTEVETDPISMGYVLTNVTQLIKQINDPAANVGGDTVAQELNVALLLDVVDTDDFDAPQVTDGERRFIESFLNRDFNENINRWKEKIKLAFRATSGTSQAIDALVRPISRAEVLFGEGTSLTRDDWFAARDS